MKKATFFAVILYFLFSFQDQAVTWVAIGDSITYLNDHPDETGNRITKGYLTLVTEKLPHIKYINQGHNGWTSGLIAENIDKLGLVKADVYSVFLGTNDWWRGRPIGQLDDYQNNTGNHMLYGSYRIIIDKLKSLNKDAHIILITPMQRGDFVYLTNMQNNAYGSYKAKNEQQLSQFADAIIAIGKANNYTVVDLFNKSGITQKNMVKVKYKRLKDPTTGQYKNFKYPDYVDVPLNLTADEYPYPLDAVNMTYDGLHPSDKGYRVIAKLLIKELKRL
jgi:lysophospholipase L1-like esterase